MNLVISMFLEQVRLALIACMDVIYVVLRGLYRTVCFLKVKACQYVVCSYGWNRCCSVCNLLFYRYFSFENYINNRSRISDELTAEHTRSFKRNCNCWADNDRNSCDLCLPRQKTAILKLKT